jgi:predicted PurR-regulated permease PerM
MMAQDTTVSPPWGSLTKFLVALIGLGLLMVLLARFHAIVPLLVLSGIVAYLMLPFVRALHRRAHLSWPLATSLAFLVLVMALVTAITASGVALVQQLQTVFLAIQGWILRLPDELEKIGSQAFFVGPWRLDFSQLSPARAVEPLLASLQPALTQVGSLLTTIAAAAVEGFAGLAFVLAVAYFLTLDYRVLVSGWMSFSMPRFGEDIQRLKLGLARIWNAFLRGQLLIVLITGVLTWILMTVLGIQSALALGALGGLAKFVPIVGPVSAGAVAALVAFFQPGHVLALSPLAHAALVVACVFVMDQLIDYLLIPRIMGTSLNLHPVVVLVGAIVGASLAGVLGLLLAAPSMATLTLLARYAYRKLVDLSPWNPPIDAPPPPRPRLTERHAWLGGLERRLRSSSSRQPEPPS